jgi:hypothetical protein
MIPALLLGLAVLFATVVFLIGLFVVFKNDDS